MIWIWTSSDAGFWTSLSHWVRLVIIFEVFWNKNAWIFRSSLHYFRKMLKKKKGLLKTKRPSSIFCCFRFRLFNNKFSKKKTKQPPGFLSDKPLVKQQKNLPEADQDLLEDMEQGFEGRQSALRKQSENLRCRGGWSGRAKLLGHREWGFCWWWTLVFFYGEMQQMRWWWWWWWWISPQNQQLKHAKKIRKENQPFTFEGQIWYLYVMYVFWKRCRVVKCRHFPQEALT